MLDAYPHELSGGMRQRVAIALATICRPEFIIADEPTTALDVVVQKDVLALMREIQREMASSMLFVTHDMSVHANMADRLGIMYAGRLVEEAPTPELFARPLHPYTQHLIQSLPRIGDTPREPGQDLVEFPRFMAKLAASGATAKYRRPRCVGEISLKDAGPLNEDLGNFRKAVDAAKPAEAFMNAASPGVLALFQPNDHYASQDAYLEALGNAMQAEYEAIAEAGFLLQIDAPDFGMGRHTMYRTPARTNT